MKRLGFRFLILLISFIAILQFVSCSSSKKEEPQPERKPSSVQVYFLSFSKGESDMNPVVKNDCLAVSSEEGSKMMEDLIEENRDEGMDCWKRSEGMDVICESEVKFSRAIISRDLSICQQFFKKTALPGK